MNEIENGECTNIVRDKGKEVIKYGELVVLGYNGCFSRNEGKRRSKFVLCKRAVPNGVKKSKHYVVKTPQCSEAVLDKEQHSISYTLSRNQAVIVEYNHDGNTDMFQIGRSSEPPIDFVVLDTLVDGAVKNETNNKLLASTISRFACRIVCERNNPSVARIFAAGFDSSRNIFLGEKATKWQSGYEIDGMTTNGVLIMHPEGFFSDGNAIPGVWLEVSIDGGIYSLRTSRSAPVKGREVVGIDNVLRDGTLIDLCGATLLWRTAEGLTKSPTNEFLEDLVNSINANRPTCPVGLNTLVIPHKLPMNSNQQQPYVYLSCGHVQGHHDWGLNKESNFRTCPMCLKVGQVVKLCMGVESAFYVSNERSQSLFAFCPCGHITTENTAKYWSKVTIPHGTNGFEAVCPFCSTLLEGCPGYVRLIFN